MRYMLMSLALAAAAGPISGWCAEQGGGMKVSFAGLDTATPAGRAEAVKRINAAAVKLCRDIPEEGDRLTAQVAFQDCVKRASQPAVDALPPVAAVAQAAG